MSLTKTEHTTVAYKVTCDGCQKNNTTVTVSEYWLDSEMRDALPENWEMFTTRLLEAGFLCPDCDRCETAGHSWEPVTDGIVCLEHKIQCRVCGYAPHAPEREWLTEDEVEHIVIAPGPNFDQAREGA